MMIRFEYTLGGVRAMWRWHFALHMQMDADRASRPPCSTFIDDDHSRMVMLRSYDRL